MDAEITIDDGSGECTLFIDKDTNIDGSPEPTGEIDIVGVVTQYDTAVPYDCCHRLTPRSTADITTSSAGVDIASSDGGIISRILPNPTKGQLRMYFGSEAVHSAKEITFYDVTGRAVGNARVASGESVLDWEARDSRGNALPSGVYFARVKTMAGEEEAKIVLLR
jgi:hypothetical protein